ncbi:P-loop containing nucleoside triphosphate hydrolase protein [Hygrophoropsis aurantiaca]|uniref:P-loop containing nucleoside triphosphate hydrolase protein n=1 Tax=Hygrophoropsis aurantiaca TaxID=72124 RepID=A0ACB7ZRG1_9AGAM|nr:P-loop containing nucleoside triphosphate hydrolase protein [Hygrophoropsis aurantiaca]
MPSTIPGIPNIILFGKTGSGKSSLINLIAGDCVAKTSPGAAGSTFDGQSYLVPVSTRTFRLWDTVGLNEPSLDVNGYLVAIEKAIKLIRDLEHEGITLLMFCIRGGRITAAAQNNYRLFFDILCDKEVPIALVITNLENQPSMEGWWEANKKPFDRFGMHIVGHACIAAHPGPGDVHSDKHVETRQKMYELLLSQTCAQAWKPEKTEWLTRLLGQLLEWNFGRSGSSGSRLGHQDLANGLKRCGCTKYETICIASKIIHIGNGRYDGLVSLGYSDELDSVQYVRHLP